MGSITHVTLAKLCNTSGQILKLQSGHDFHTDDSKGDNSTKNVSGVMVLVLWASADDALYLYQVL